MESGGTTSNTRMKRARSRNKDMISNKLPESIISYVLSLLPTKEAVRTCVLSKKWINRWTSITKLQLDDNELLSCCAFCSFCTRRCTLMCFENKKDGSTICDHCYFGGSHKFPSLTDNDLEIVRIDQVTERKKETFGKVERFVNFVSRTLLLSKMDLESFSFVIYNKHDALNTWISNILNRRVKKIKILSSFYKLPFSALTSYYLFNSSSTSSLQELELILKHFSVIQVSNSSLHFRNLKLIKLSGIFFKIDPSIDSMNLNLPLLNKFEIKNCNWSSGKDIIVQAPLLETVSVEQDHDFYKAKSHNPPCNRSIKFNALYLKEFNYCGDGISQKVHLPSYDSSKIILRKCKKNASEKGRLPFINLLLRQLHHAKSIKFEEFDMDLNILMQAEVPAFSKLSHLELGLVTIEVLIGLLQKSPVLKTLVLKGIPTLSEENLSSVVAPDCLISSLQVLKFENFGGDEHELVLAKFLIENGIMLEKVDLSIVAGSQRLNKYKVVTEFKEIVNSFRKGVCLSILNH